MALSCDLQSPVSYHQIWDLSKDHNFYVHGILKLVCSCKNLSSEIWFRNQYYLETWRFRKPHALKFKILNKLHSVNRLSESIRFFSRNFLKYVAFWRFQWELLISSPVLRITHLYERSYNYKWTESPHRICEHWESVFYVAISWNPHLNFTLQFMCF